MIDDHQIVHGPIELRDSRAPRCRLLADLQAVQQLQDGYGGGAAVVRPFEDGVLI